MGELEAVCVYQFKVVLRGMSPMILAAHSSV